MWYFSNSSFIGKIGVSTQMPLLERKCLARLTREYTDGGAGICADNEFGEFVCIDH
jgi:hypothetical protein